MLAIIAIIITFLSCNAQIMEFKLYFNRTLNKLTIDGALGTPKQTQTFNIDIGNPVSFCYEKTFNSTTSNSYATTHKLIPLQQYSEGLESTDSIRLLDFSMRNFYFVQFPETQYGYSMPHLGLGKGQGSFIDQLYEGGHIQKRIFHINEDSLYIGGAPEPSENKCSLLNTGRKYSCNINSLVFDNNPIITGNIYSYDHIIINQKASFETNILQTSVPAAFLKSFQETLFKGLFKENEVGSPCIIIPDYNYKLIYCNHEVIERLPDFHLLFGDVDLLIKSSKLWDEKVNNYVTKRQFLIQFDFSIDEWIFGYSIIKNIPITFSEEENYLSFTSSEVRQVILSYDFLSSMRYKVISIAALVLCIGLVMLIVQRKQLGTEKPIMNNNTQGQLMLLLSKK